MRTSFDSTIPDWKQSRLANIVTRKRAAWDIISPHKKAPKPKVAEEDIPVQKVITKDNTLWCWEHIRLEKGKPCDSLPLKIKTINTDLYIGYFANIHYFNNDDGYYSFSMDAKVERVKQYRKPTKIVVKTKYGSYQYEEHGDCKNALFVIPKGTKYYYNRGVYFSETIKMI